MSHKHQYSKDIKYCIKEYKWLNSIPGISELNGININRNNIVEKIEDKLVIYTDLCEQKSFLIDHIQE